ncbi:hypothetical protein TVAG_391560 [Trichomonas vaginalis G3]|uniref:DUF3447 domain-containing protein n=1 Tax=Trichomonas vaginalis (strain ATCC PRA-98 / G3) TaxID=412133 RepID=A2DFR9_TRIV3|nr:spectrin binding [Trichomonas vaginalis G3]EAY20772.1 hypothetical protein TVAG_391560 [Trichomonas vaginalis G3]KAI5529443.1 spectrin binding [Trichomonas vaginalis G3]|eukprot:XP_001581758.1 hypothetical protein [Trichomonas vaginalis G3]
MKLFFEEYSNPKESNPIIKFVALSKNPNILDILFKYGYSFEKYSDICKFKIKDALRAAMKNVPTFEILLKKYCESILEKDSRLVIDAFRCASNSALRLLLDAKFNPSYMTEDHRTPISLACAIRNVEAVKILAEVTEDVDIPPDIKAPAAVRVVQTGTPAGTPFLASWHDFFKKHIKKVTFCPI